MDDPWHVYERENKFYFISTRKLPQTTGVKACRCPASCWNPCRGSHATRFTSKKYAGLFISYTFLFCIEVIDRFLRWCVDSGVHSRGSRWPSFPERGSGDGWGTLQTGYFSHYSFFSLHCGWKQIWSVDLLGKRVFFCAGERGRQGEGELWEAGVDSEPRTEWRSSGGIKINNQLNLHLLCLNQNMNI